MSYQAPDAPSQGLLQICHCLISKCTMAGVSAEPFSLVFLEGVTGCVLGEGQP